MSRMLMLANAASFLLLFNMDNILLLQKLGVAVEVAANFEEGNTTDAETVARFREWCDEHGVKCHHIAACRNVYDFRGDIASYRQLMKIVRDGHFDFIHCHTPIGGVLGRLAGHRAKIPVIYTAHGFHFYKGGPLKYKLLYYPVERLLAPFTKTLITINEEDYAVAKRMAGKRAEYVPGIGLDLDRFRPDAEKRAETRGALGLSDDEIMILSVGEMIPRKNYGLAFRVLARLKNEPIYPLIRYYICGIGEQKEELERYARELGISDTVHFAGFCRNVEDMYAAADLFLFTSKQEGLPMALLNSMGCGVPAVCTRIRGNVDLIPDDTVGRVADDEKTLAAAVTELIGDRALRERISGAARRRSGEFSKERVHERMEAVYRRILQEGD